MGKQIEEISVTLKAQLASLLCEYFEDMSPGLASMSIEYHWEDILSACRSVSPCCLIWMNKIFLGSAAFPCLVSSKAEQVENSVLLLTHLALAESNSRENEVEEKVIKSKEFKVQAKLIRCCGAESLVEERIPIEYSKSLFFAKDKVYPQLRAIKSAGAGLPASAYDDTLYTEIEADLKSWMLMFENDDIFRNNYAHIVDLHSSLLTACLNLDSARRFCARFTCHQLYADYEKSLLEILQGDFVIYLIKYGELRKVTESLALAMQCIATDSVENWCGSLIALVGILPSILNFSRGLSHASTLCLMNCISCMVASSAWKVDNTSSIQVYHKNMVHTVTALSDLKGSLVSILKEINCKELTSSDLERSIGPIVDMHSELKSISEIAFYQMRFSCLKSLEGSLEGIKGILDDVAELLELQSEWSNKPQILEISNLQEAASFDSLLVQLHGLDSRAIDLIKKHFSSLPNTKSMIAIVQKLDQIIEMNTTQCSFESEVQSFYKVLDSRVELLKEHFENRKTSPPVIRGATRFTSALVWLRCVKSRLCESSRSVENTFLQASHHYDWNVIKTQADAIDAYEKRWIYAWVQSNGPQAARLHGPIITIDQHDRTLTSFFSEQLDIFLQDLRLLNRMMYILPKSLEGPSKIAFQCLGRHRLVLSICSDLKSFKGGHVHVGAIDVLEDTLLEWIFQAGTVMAETVSWTSVSSEGMLNEIRDRVSTLRGVKLTLNTMEKDLRRHIPSIVHKSMGRILRFSDAEFSPEDFFSGLRGVSKHDFPSLFKDLKCETLRIAADYCLTIQESLLDVDHKGLFEVFSSSLKGDMIHMIFREALKTFVDRIASMLFQGYNSPEGSEIGNKPYTTIRIPLSFDPLTKYLEGAECIRKLSDLFCDDLCSLICYEFERSGLTLSREEARLETIGIEKAAKHLHSFLSAHIQHIQGGLHPIIARFDELVNLMGEIERDKIDDILYAMTLSSELGDQIADQPRESKISPNFVLSFDKALDWLQNEVHNYRTCIEANFQDAISGKIDSFQEECHVAILMIEEHDFGMNLDLYSSRMIGACSLRQHIMIELPEIEDALKKAERAGLAQNLGHKLSNLGSQVQRLDAIIGDSMIKAMRGEENNFLEIMSLECELKGLMTNLYDTWDNSVIQMEDLDLKFIQERREKLEAAAFKISHLENLCKLFGRSTGDFYPVLQAFAEACDLHQVFETYQELENLTKDIKDLQWDEFIKNQMHYAERLETFDDIIGRLPKDSKCNIRIWPAFKMLQRELESTASYLSLLVSIARNDLKERHWIKLRTFIDCEEVDPSKGFATAKLWTQELLVNREEIEDMLSLSAKELNVEKKITELQDQWDSECLHVCISDTKKPLLHPSETAELMEKLEDSIMLLNSLNSNRASISYKEELQVLLKSLVTVEETMQLWLSTQSSWSHLEAVFSEGKIADQIPEAADRFLRLNVEYLKIIEHAREDPAIFSICSSESMRNAFIWMSEELDVCQKSLTDFLDSKRSIFPRFYFVSDATLLEILSQSSNPREVAKHFQSGIFDGIADISFDEKDESTIIGMSSKDGEYVPLLTPVKVSGGAEEWLGKLVNSMQEAIKYEIKRSCHDIYKMMLKDFIFSRPAQAALVGLQVRWTAEIQSALAQASMGKKGALSKALQFCDKTLSEMKVMTLDEELTQIQMTSLETCITVHIHQRDTVQDLIENKVSDPKDFQWLRHCRFRWKDDKQTLMIYICDNEFEYGYEYLGVRERLVMTQLTDICYITLTQALGMYYGGAPAGPAGTGKTETTKDLGATLGKYVVVFNCSDQMDHQAMGRIFKGLAQAGFWGCFDEFNRINLDVLSVCAQQLNCILSALKDQKSDFIFTDGSCVPLNNQVGYFITMNPGYAGRQELPENLKCLFRGVTMMAPNRQTIINVKLAASGFQDSLSLSKKFDKLYLLCEQQLSRQPHYDFGLRNILSVLRSAGSAKRKNPDMKEIDLLMKTLEDMNLSKFVAEDVHIFTSLLDDIFPPPMGTKIASDKFEQAIQQVCDENGMISASSWTAKCLQLYETSAVRHGMMVVGPPRSGKTTAVETVASALTSLGSKTVVWRMNPKAITAPQMFGRLDPVTDDWTDGIFSSLWRKASRSSHSVWIVLDGPIDAVWIENLNTVLDDNRVLTLANGDRIRMTSKMRLIFEAENLNNASPATVSRAGIVYFSSTVLGWEPILYTWAKKHNASLLLHHSTALVDLFQRLVDCVTLDCQVSVERTEVEMIEATLAYFRGYLERYPSLMASLQSTNESKSNDLDTNIKFALLFCMTWGIAGCLSRESRFIFKSNIENIWPSILGSSESSKTLHDYFFDFSQSRWILWEDLMPKFDPCSIYQAVSEMDFSKVVVPTCESFRCSVLLSLLQAGNGVPLVIGPRGTAKTTMICQYAHDSSLDEKSDFKLCTLSSCTTPSMLQKMLESFIERRQGRTYGPPGGKSTTILIDDLSMPEKNKWGDQTTNELFRQLLEVNGFYGLERPIGEMKQIVDVRFITAATKSEDEALNIPERLRGKLCPILVLEPLEEEIQSLFTRIAQVYCNVQKWDDSLLQRYVRLIHHTIEFWKSYRQHMRPDASENKFHYLSTIKDISRVIQGLVSSGIRNCEDLDLLWTYECSRIFVDKLSSQSDKAWATQVLEKNTFEQSRPKKADISSLYFSNIAEDSETSFAFCTKVDLANASARKGIETFILNLSSESTNIVLFKDAIEHILRICRVLQSCKGSIMLVGLGGSGKQSLARVAASVNGTQFYQADESDTYSGSSFLEDLKSAFRVSGIKNKSTCFLLTNSSVKNISFLDYTNQYLVTGDIAGLWEKEDLESIESGIRGSFREECKGKLDTSENLYNYFMQRVNKNFHFILSFSSAGGQLFTWSQQFPGLMSGCTIDWFLDWPQDALLSVAQSQIYLEGECMDSEEKSELHKKVHSIVGKIHTLVSKFAAEYRTVTKRRVYTTPKSYLSLLAAFKELYILKVEKINRAEESLMLGLEKMNSAKADVDNMKEELKQKQKDLSRSQAETEKLVSEIKKSKEITEKEQMKVGTIVSDVTAKAAEIAKVKEEAEIELNTAKPALDAALSALNSIASKDLVALKALRNPPDVIKRILDCVLILRHLPVKKVEWHAVKDLTVISATYEGSLKMMSEMNFLNNLLNFPKDQINDETVELLEPYFNSNDFNFKSAKKASGNVAGLCNWAESMCKYHQVAREVEPKIIRLKKFEKELGMAEGEQAEAEKELLAVEASLQALQDKFEDTTRKQARLQQAATATAQKMENAITLVTSLGGEEKRWKEQLLQLQEKRKCILGDCLSACTFTTYLGPFGASHREKYLTQIIDELNSDQILVSRDFQPIHFLAESSEILSWISEGLPTDDFSLQNGMLLTNSPRVPLVIDPQGQALKWLQQRYKTNKGVRSVTASSPALVSILEECICQGLPLLVENLESNPSATLDQVINGATSDYITLGDKEVQITKGFQMILTTRQANPDMYPETFAKTTVIDFTVSKHGLEEQLLAFLIEREKSDLYKERKRLDEEVRSCEQKIRNLEADLLTRLSTSTGDILEDSELISVLADTKSISIEVSNRLQEASVMKAEINDSCEKYRGAASRASLLYFLLVDFSAVNCMYQISLSQFLGLLDQSIRNATKSLDCVEVRVKNIATCLTETVYRNANLGTFERDVNVLRLLMATRIAAQSDKSGAVQAEVDCLLSPDATRVKEKPKPRDWLSDVQWRGILNLESSLPKLFNNLSSSFLSLEAKWKSWMGSAAPETLASPLGSHLSILQHACLVRYLREDRSTSAIQSFISNFLGIEFMESMGLDLSRVSIDTLPNNPIICVISPGADPTNMIAELAKKNKVKCLSVSMGQGQETFAWKCVKEAKQSGDWVCIQNAHLSIDYLKSLEEYLRGGNGRFNDSFRLWITTEAEPLFPLGLLHSGTRVTCEPPSGLKNSLKDLFLKLDPEILDEVRMPQWKPLLMSMCILHVIVQERKKFGPIGWNVPYEFSHTDLKSSLLILSNHLQDRRGKKAKPIDWEALRYLIGTVQYGGKIIDERDQDLMRAYCARYISPEFSLGNIDIVDKKCLPKLADSYSFTVSEKTTMKDVKSFFDFLPSNDIPEVFGMDSSADLSFRIREAKRVLLYSALASPRAITSNESTATIDKTIDARVLSMINKIPKKLKAFGNCGRDKSFISAKSPLGTYFKNEIKLLNVTIDIVMSDLDTLLKALDGRMPTTSSCLQRLDEILTDTIPSTWSKDSWTSESLTLWLHHLKNKHATLKAIMENGKPKSLWIPGVINVKALFNAVVQDSIRQHSTEETKMDDLDVSLVITKFGDGKGVREYPKEGIYIHGCLIEGGAWDMQTGKVVASTSHSVQNKFPVIHVKTMKRGTGGKSKSLLPVPFYTSSRRTGKTFVCQIPLAINGHPQEWVIRGVAIVSQE